MERLYKAYSADCLGAIYNGLMSDKSNKVPLFSDLAKGNGTKDRRSAAEIKQRLYELLTQ